MEAFVYDMQCTKPITIQFNGDTRKQAQLNLKYPSGLEVPCGKCLACRISKVREWSVRMTHELEFHEKSVFITLTYKDQYLPENASIKKRDLQLFFKRLRKALGKRKIRYFACGEYGDETERPHYHIILYGMGLQNDDKKIIMDCWPYTDWSVRSIVQKAFGMVEPLSIQYVAKYIHKQYNGEKEKELYTDRGRETPFRVMSLGIGRDFSDKYHDKLNDMGFCTVRGTQHSIPRYYLKRHKMDVEKMKKKASQRDAEVVEHYSKIADLTSELAYLVLKPDEVRIIEDGKKQARELREKTLETKTTMFKRKL